MIRLAFIFFLSSYVMSQVFSEYSYVGVQGAAMAGSVISHTSNENGIFQNPASISGVEGKVAMIGQANIVNQSYLPYMHLGLIYNMPVVGKLGMSYQSLSTEYDGTSLSAESSFSLSKGIFLQKDKNSSLSLGIRTNFLIWDQSGSAGSSGDGSEGFEAYQSSAVGLDFGIIGGLRDKYWVGGYLTNINSPVMSGINLPRKISISLGFSPIDNIYTNISMERLLGRNDRQVKLGFKYDLNSTLSVMSGVQSNPNRFGIGIEYRIFNGIILGYSILTHHIMNETHNFEIKFK